MYRTRRFLALLALCPIISPALVRAEEPAKIPSYYVKKVASTPDLTQTEHDARLPGRGKHYCVPVAVSNSFIWLVKNGYPRLAPMGRSKLEVQAKIAGLLGSRKYMASDPEEGTSMRGLLVGVQRYIRDRGYEYERLEYQGDTTHDREFWTGVSVPELDWIKAGLLGPSAVWLEVQLCKYRSKTNTYYYTAQGHVMTLVGYGIDKKGRRDPNVLIVHDSWGARPKHTFYRVEQIKSGWLSKEAEWVEWDRLHRPRTGRRGRLVINGKVIDADRSAAGYLKLADGPGTTRGSYAILIDGAVVLQMKPPGPPDTDPPPEDP